MKHSYLGIADDAHTAETRILENEEELERNSNEADNTMRSTIADLKKTQDTLAQAQKDIAAIPEGTVDNAANLGGNSPDYYLDRQNHTGTQTSATISDFQDGVTSNSNVSANTSARHTHSNKALLDTYKQTEANLADAVALKHTHANKAELDLVSDGDHDVRTDNPHAVSTSQIGAVDLSTDQTIGALKTFDLFPQKYWDGVSAYPQPTAPMELATKLYVYKARPYTIVIGSGAGADYDNLGATDVRNAILAGNQKIFIRAGNYPLDYLDMSSTENIVIEGQGKESTVLSFNSSALLLDGASNIIFKNITLRLADGSPFFSGNVYSQPAGNIIFENVKFDNLNYSYGLYFYNTTLISVNDCEFVGTGVSVALLFQKSTKCLADHNRFSGSYGFTPIGVYPENEDTFFLRNIIEASSFEYLLFIRNGAGVTIEDNTFRTIPSASVWKPSFSYSVDNYVLPINPGKYFWYKCTVAGESGTSEPTWPTTPGDTVTDNEVTWECNTFATGKIGIYIYNYYSQFEITKNKIFGNRFESVDYGIKIGQGTNKANIDYNEFSHNNFDAVLTSSIYNGGDSNLFFENKLIDNIFIGSANKYYNIDFDANQVDFENPQRVTPKQITAQGIEKEFTLTNNLTISIGTNFVLEETLNLNNFDLSLQGINDKIRFNEEA